MLGGIVKVLQLEALIHHDDCITDAAVDRFQISAELFPLKLQSPVFNGMAGDAADLQAVKRFAEVIKGTVTDRFSCGGYIRITGHHNYTAGGGDRRSGLEQG